VAISTVLFDWDGTLLDSAAASLRCFQKTFREFGIEMTAARHDEIYAPDWYTMYTALGLPREMWPQADRRWLEHFDGEEPHLLDGAAAAIEDLRRRGLRVGIVSSGTRHRIERELQRLGLTGVFGALVCNEDVAKRKPHPEGLERALALLGSLPAEGCMVGDTPEDIRMGQAAGVWTVGVPSRYATEARLLEARPDAMVTGIRMLPEALPAGPAAAGMGST
jgi:HAD superfamily hydrolase (TIGR01549 family)